MTRPAWIAVASAEHVALGRAGGFMQVCHGKAAPLRRLRDGDRVICYSPSRRFGLRDGLMAFSGLGTVAGDEVFQVEMAPGFRPWRRQVAWEDARETPIHPLLPHLALAADRRGWGYRFRQGLVAITPEDGAVIAAAMARGR